MCLCACQSVASVALITDIIAYFVLKSLNCTFYSKLDKIRLVFRCVVAVKMAQFFDLAAFWFNFNFVDDDIQTSYTDPLKGQRL